MNNTSRFSLVGIGFGPSNIALAIALREQGLTDWANHALFMERQPEFSWHKNMMLENTHMQISFLKDLVTIRNPKSEFTFINYLHQKNRLADFINLQTFFPSRHEFNDYLAWAASHFKDQTSYGETVFDVQPILENEQVVALQVHSRGVDGSEKVVETDNLVISIGGGGYIPKQFRKLAGDTRVFHSNDYKVAIEANNTAKKIAVIGAGQSAAEIFMDLHGRADDNQVDFVIRANSIKPSDDSPFVNEIFNAEYTDKVFSKSDIEREAFLKEYRQTNYACPDLPLIEQIYGVFYEQKVRSHYRHRFLSSTEVAAVDADENGIHLTLTNRKTGDTKVCSYDAVVLATGYVRDQHKTLLAPLSKYLGDFTVGRDYRIQSTEDFKPNIFLQGACESSHGLSDTLLSILAVRSQEIGEVLKQLKQTSTPQVTDNTALVD
ncbi:MULTISPECIES: lysine N(6)-hydroxylase/L-ornithine N(5)-oxygenase family protein [unclassified Pseudoalteromonas]|uniref:lysine N(6)-hydroxylase/L-ornithine N(5)-oxygenase family protein n=1 Tax=unclassified Pseudoalteromonas TaxID=194690 RepID=UPI001F3AE5E1|nr:MULTISPECIES: lysine N(6)-hydroxylase/L-ornithine N(5)-oxygenase family protein [unclassified Pseudoalteromonas]MCF2829121.1 lysine N(6)-hydroxylase/L-ornithine N(5)-oxygenase family protein [Pseudoalteromonas sp. OF5H-5]MCF2831558.1 lysine N(6)-hydroxylase/L-ornithine N(5)-oxygenase family protein [Pseudoalteromonas sp. DL2-H6]MCF2927371.1 lysine N(6)-hydroxylase/L-ornithine N(5)-oxygenase family protein [Pseudoalteromonas sp. DL2-H1]